jgi:hypothetical protein
MAVVFILTSNCTLAFYARFLQTSRFSEDVTEDMVTKFRLNRILFDSKSEFQRIQVLIGQSIEMTISLWPCPNNMTHVRSQSLARLYVSWVGTCYMISMAIEPLLPAMLNVQAFLHFLVRSSQIAPLYM